MNRAIVEEAQELIHQADAAHQAALLSLEPGEKDRPLDAIANALLALDWRLRALMLGWLEMERPAVQEAPHEEGTT